MKKSFYWLGKAAEQGYVSSQMLLALYYLQGTGTVVNKNKAAYWAQKAYENGHNNAKDFWEINELWKYKE